MGVLLKGVAAAAASLCVLAAPASADVTFAGKWGVFGSLPGQFKQPRGVATDPAGNVYVGDTGNSRVQKFAAAGSLLTAWGSTGTGPGQFGQASAYGVAFDAGTGIVYVADRNNHRVQKFSGSGAFLGAFGSFGTALGRLSAPQGVAVDRAGNVFVSEFSNHRIQKFSAAGVPLAIYGGRGSADGRFEGPADVAVDSAGGIYVADAGNNRIQKLTAAGTFAAKWGGFGTGAGQISNPQGVAVDGDNVYVADSGNRRIQEFSLGGAFRQSFGSLGTTDGRFNGPTDVTRRGTDIYVADTANARIQRFRAEPPPPVLGLTVNVRPVRGKVFVKVPGRRAAPLDAARQIPVRSQLDTRKGVVALVSAQPRVGAVQAAQFSAGVFQVLQSRRRSAKGLTEVRLKGGSFRRCRRARRAAEFQAESSARSRRRIRRLRGNGRGRFRTRGRYSSATVRGTEWTVTDRCDGTLTAVRRGRVAVRDFRRRKTISVRAGKRYLARAPG